jgi:hypothetical protein
MADEWKPKVGDVVWAKGTIRKLDTDNRPHQVDFQHGVIWFPRGVLRPDAPAPAALDDVAVLRRAAGVLKREGWKDGSVGILMLDGAIDTIEARNRVPTPLEALKALVATTRANPQPCNDAEYAVWEAARRAIAAAEAKGAV